eukprot:TRINITY_DN119_c0_g1_i2.p1 TRINITY_DN119_c0_g1~~TRINITY_DN119_c0_g1_i2.p1  ORF type:complete len:353 (+),score=53.22 TRINITY_DN119_c0_g1_i2:418-1476(+)
MPSEHAVDGRLLYAELHAVHQLEGATGLESLLVCGVMYQLGGASTFLSYVFPVLAGSSSTEIRNIRLDDELTPAAALGFYAYEGSLTTPPCTETVQWIVFKNHLTVGQPQVDEFHKLFPHPENNRPLQPYFGRFVVEDDDGIDDDEEPVPEDECLPTEATVVTKEMGSIPLGRVRAGINLLVKMPSGETAFETVLGFIHEVATGLPGQPIAIVGAEHVGGVLQATPRHLVFKLVDGVPVTCPIGELRVGDHLVVGSSSVEGKRVVALHAGSASNGVVSPVTASGSAVIDGIHSSTYAIPRGVPFSQGFFQSCFYFVRLLAHLHLPEAFAASVGQWSEFATASPHFGFSSEVF